MKFDFTQGREPRYMVSIYRELVSDQLYYPDYWSAKRSFDIEVDKFQEKGTIISLYNLKTDERKAFKRF